MKSRVWLAFPLAAMLHAQQNVAPTDERTGKPRGQDFGEYNVVNSFEVGYRFRTVGGDLGKFRSDVNYSNGLRLLSSFLTVNSKDGHGRFFDEIVLTTQGLGNDPYQSASLRIQKNRLYRYDLMWRENDYFSPVLPISYGEHLMDTSRRMQDHDLTLLPQSNFRFFLGYSRNSQTGPALSTIQLFDARGDEFPLFSNVRRVRNEYRVGNEIRAFGFRLNWMHGWDDFKEDTPVSLLAPSAGNNPADSTTLTSLSRTEPYHGTSPYWRVALFKEGRDWYSLNGRFTYTAGRRAFVQDETEFGTARIGSTNQHIITFGDANRPVATGNLTFSIFPGSRVTLTNQTSVYNLRIDGNSFYRVINSEGDLIDTLNFQYLGIRTIANETELNVRLNSAVGMFAGYEYTNRRIRSIEGGTFAGVFGAVTGDQTNRLNAGRFGLRLKPVKPLTVIVDGEIGRTDKPIYPISDRNYHALGARLQYRLRSFSLSAYARSNYNVNSVSLSSFSSQARNYAADLSWTPRTWLSFDASYAKLHLNTAGGIQYFANGQQVTGDTSYYLSNLHHTNLIARFDFRGRADLYVGFSRVQDTGDGRSTLLGNGIGSALPAFQAAQTFPLTYQSPIARLSLKLHERVRWNVGYQYYGYSEVFSSLQSYQANTGYTSLLWSF